MFDHLLGRSARQDYAARLLSVWISCFEELDLTFPTPVMPCRDRILQVSLSVDFLAYAMRH